MKVVQILGTAPNLVKTPYIEGAERWCANHPRSYTVKGFPEALATYSRWFNLHTLKYIQTRYPDGFNWYTKQSKPIYLQRAHSDIESSVTFPKEQLQFHFGTEGIPCRYFSCTAAWLIAFAIYEGFERIELHGFELTLGWKYTYERPCFFYWVEKARSTGIDVYLPPNVLISEAGDPAAYTDHVYGYEPHNKFYARFF